jgi:hypothetical protein
VNGSKLPTAERTFKLEAEICLPLENEMFGSLQILKL